MTTKNNLKVFIMYDILLFACMQFQKPMWEVLTGRRDGTISRTAEVLSNLPSPFLNFDQLKNNFALKNLTVHDLVVLSGILKIEEIR